MFWWFAFHHKDHNLCPVWTLPLWVDNRGTGHLPTNAVAPITALFCPPSPTTNHPPSPHLKQDEPCHNLAIAQRAPILKKEERYFCPFGSSTSQLHFCHNTIALWTQQPYNLRCRVYNKFTILAKWPIVGRGFFFGSCHLHFCFQHFYNSKLRQNTKQNNFSKRNRIFGSLLRPLTTSYCLHALSSALKQHFREYKIIWRRRSAIVGCYLRSRNVALDSLRKKQKDRHRGFFFVNKTRQREIAIFLWTELLYNHHGNFLLCNHQQFET